MPPKSKCLRADHNTKETCKPSCVWRDGQCSPGRSRSPSPRKPSKWNQTVSQVAKQHRESGDRVSGPVILKQASERYWKQNPGLARAADVRGQQKERSKLYQQFKTEKPKQSGGDNLSQDDELSLYAPDEGFFH